MTSSTFQQALDAGECFLFDGSTASALHDRGITLQRSFEECNLKAPDLLLAIHGEFLAAGAQVLTSNTWGAGRLKLATRGLDGDLAAINRTGVELARRAIAQQGSRAWVAGCIGPLGVRIEPWGPTSFDEARALFREQATPLIEAGADLIVLEGFEDLNEIHQAILAVQEAGDLPIAALMTTNEDGQALFGAEPDWFIKQLDTWGADMVGLIGGNGPAPHLRLLEKLKAVTAKPIVLQPNPGLPNMVDGRLIYGASPEYLGGFASRALAAGARAVGGCSGTTPAHIRAMRGAFQQERAFVQAGGGFDRNVGIGRRHGVHHGNGRVAESRIGAHDVEAIGARAAVRDAHEGHRFAVRQRRAVILRVDAVAAQQARRAREPGAGHAHFTLDHVQADRGAHLRVVADHDGALAGFVGAEHLKHDDAGDDGDGDGHHQLDDREAPGLGSHGHP